MIWFSPDVSLQYDMVQYDTIQYNVMQYAEHFLCNSNNVTACKKEF